MAKKLKFLPMEHTADIKFEIYGKDFKELLENSSLAFSWYISGENKIKNKLKKKFSLKGENPENLLYLFLEELIYLLDAEDFAVSTSKIKIDGMSLIAEVIGDSSKKYNLNHVKAATYHDMLIEIRKGKSKAQFILDV